MAIYENEIIVEDVDGVDNNKVEAECLYMEVGSVRLVRLFFVLLYFLLKFSETMYQLCTTPPGCKMAKWLCQERLSVYRSQSFHNKTTVSN